MSESILNNKEIVVIGAGNIGQILVKRLRECGTPAGHLTICDSNIERAETLTGKYGVRKATLSDEMIHTADAILLATPPKAVLEMLENSRKQLRAGQTVISFAAAVPLERLESLLPEGVTAVRVMPNAPSFVGAGLNPVAFGRKSAKEGRDLALAILTCLGDMLEVSDDLMNWCVGLSGAAMRSLVPVLEGMIQAGLEAGLSAGDARKVASQVMAGTAALVRLTNLTLDEIKSMTPMQTVDEGAVAQIFWLAARGAKEKIDQLQEKIVQTASRTNE